MLPSRIAQATRQFFLRKVSNITRPSFSSSRKLLNVTRTWKVDSCPICFRRGLVSQIQHDYPQFNVVTNENVDIQLLGNLNFQQSITAVQMAVTGKNYRSGWFLVTGQNISLIGPGSASQGGVIRGYGQVRRNYNMTVGHINDLTPLLALVGCGTTGWYYSVCCWKQLTVPRRQIVLFSLRGKQSKLSQSSSSDLLSIV